MPEGSKIGDAYVKLGVDDAAYKAGMNNAKSVYSAVRAVLGAGVVVGLGKLAGSALREAMEAEQAEMDLATAIKLRGGVVKELLPVYGRFADEIQRTTTLDDEAVKSAMAQALTMGVTTNKLIEATKAAIGLSLYTKDLGSAMTLVARASQGNTQMLAKYGIVLNKDASEQEKFNQVLSKGGELFQLVGERAKTAGGTIQKARNNWSEFLEGVGKNMLLVYAPLIAKLEEWTRAASDSVPASGAMAQGLDGINVAAAAAGDSLEKTKKAGMSMLSFSALWTKIQESLLGQGGSAEPRKAAAIGTTAPRRGRGLVGVGPTIAGMERLVEGAAEPAFATEAERGVAYNPPFLPGSGANTMANAENQRLGVVIKNGGGEIPKFYIQGMSDDAAKAIGKNIPFQWLGP